MDLKTHFDIDESFLNSIKIHFANYITDNFEGSEIWAINLIVKNNNIFEHIEIIRQDWRSKVLMF